MQMNIPLWLTMFRFVSVPLFVLVFLLPFSHSHLVAMVIFAIAAVTDWLDGYLARSLHQCTPFGAFLDPVADKLLVSVVLLFVVSQPFVHYLTIPAAVIIGREILISSLREWMAETGRRTSVAVVYISKVKTAMQMIALVVLILYTPSSPLWLFVIGSILLWVAALLTLWTMIVYLKLAWPDLTLSKEQ